MPQSVFRLCAHLVFSTRNRQPILSATVRDRVHAYMASHLRELGGDAVNIGGTDDHVHLVFVLAKSVGPAEIVKEIKSSSSAWIKTLAPDLREFAWQRGYGLFSICPSDFVAAVDYVKGQEEHHRELSFQDEYRRFLVKYHEEFDERYVWD